MNRDEILNTLWNKNPFTSSSAGNPWEGKYPDVEDVNKRSFDGLCQLIQQKAADPAENFAGLVIGEAGEGKTHLIGRILEYGKRAVKPFLFAYVHPIEDPSQTYRYLLREVIINLCHPPDITSEKSYLDSILSQSSEVPPFIAAEFPDNFMKVLSQYQTPEKRTACINWLKGSVIDEEDALLLGVRSRQDNTDAFLEQEARSILSAFGVLMARYGQPMVICFDRLENLETDEQIHALGKMVEFLVDTAKAMLPVAFVRADLWEEKFRKVLNLHVIDRLESNKLKLEGCTVEQALKIIRNRLAFVYKNKEDDLFPFNRNELIDLFKNELESPREVIKQANKLLRDILGKKKTELPSIVRQLDEEFESQYQTILTDFDRHAPDRGRLRRALKLYLENTSFESSFEIKSLRRGSDKYIDFECRIRFSESSSVPAIFIIDTELHHLSVGASLKRGIDFLKENTRGKAVYIRDPRCPIPWPPKWGATNKRLQNFKDLGGFVVLPDNHQIARWYALALFSYAVKEGDITVTDADNQMRAVSGEEFSSFIREKIHGAAYQTFHNFDKIIAESSSKDSLWPVVSGQLQQKTKDNRQPATGSKQQATSNELVAEKATEILRSTPGMMMLNSRRLAESLNQSGITIDLKDLLIVIGKFKDRFGIIPSKDGALIMLRKE